MHPQKRICLQHVIANQCAHWCGNPFSPQGSLTSWHYFGQIRNALRICPKYCPPPCPAARRCGLPRRFAPRNDRGGTSLHPRTPVRLQHVIANQCAHWCGNPFPRRGTWQVGSTSGKFVALFRICLRHCSLVCAAARRTDCHVASLLAMTEGGTSLHPLTRLCLLHVIANQCAHWCGNPFSPQGSLTSWHYFGQIRNALRICPKYCFLLCPAAGVTDCHVASLLAMTEGGRPCTREHLSVFSMSLRTSAHTGVAIRSPRREA